MDLIYKMFYTVPSFMDHCPIRRSIYQAGVSYAACGLGFRKGETSHLLCIKS